MNLLYLVWKQAVINLSNDWSSTLLYKLLAQARDIEHRAIRISCAQITVSRLDHSLCLMVEISLTTITICKLCPATPLRTSLVSRGDFFSSHSWCLYLVHGVDLCLALFLLLLFFLVVDFVVGSHIIVITNISNSNMLVPSFATNHVCITTQYSGQDRCQNNSGLGCRWHCFPSFLFGWCYIRVPVHRTVGQQGVVVGITVSNLQRRHTRPTRRKPRGKVVVVGWKSVGDIEIIKIIQVGTWHPIVLGIVVWLDPVSAETNWEIFKETVFNAEESQIGRGITRTVITECIQSTILHCNVKRTNRRNEY